MTTVFLCTLPEKAGLRLSAHLLCTPCSSLCFRFVSLSYQYLGHVHPFGPHLSIPYYYDDGVPLYFTREGRTGSQFKAKKVADAVLVPIHSSTSRTACGAQSRSSSVINWCWRTNSFANSIPYYYDDGVPLYFTREGRTGSQFKAKKVADEFAVEPNHARLQ
jgi:hypothetical protein